MAKRISDAPATTPLDERERAVLLALAEHKILATDQVEVLFCESDRTAQRVLYELRKEVLSSASSGGAREHETRTGTTSRPKA